MTSNVYLFEPAPAEADKPLAQLIREAETARSQEAARMAHSFFARVADFFERTTTEKDHVETRRPEDKETRLAA